MANETTASIVASLGHGTRTAVVYNSVGAPISMIAAFALALSVNHGYAAEGASLLGARMASPSSQSETGSAASNTALPSLPSQVTFTPVCYAGAVAPTSAAIRRVEPGTDLPKLLIDEMTYAVESKVAYDATVGIVTGLTASISTVSGTSGAALTPSAVLDAWKTLCTQVGQRVDVFLWLDLKGLVDLQKYGLGTAASILGTQQGAQQWLLDLMEAQGIDSTGYQTSWGQIHIFCDPKPGCLPTSSGDSLAPMFVPAIGGLNGMPLPPNVEARIQALARSLPGGYPIAPAFGIGYRVDPGVAPALAGAPGPLDGIQDTVSGLPVATKARGANGQQILIVDVTADFATAIVSQNSCVAVRYVS
jgi:hypothetical protein